MQTRHLKQINVILVNVPTGEEMKTIERFKPALKKYGILPTFGEVPFKEFRLGPEKNAKSTARRANDGSRSSAQPR